MKIIYVIILVASLAVSTGCQSKSADKSATTAAVASEDSSQTETIDPGKIKEASAAEILKRKQVPILCYHQVRDWKAKDSQGAKDYIIPIATFKAQMKMLADSGYHTILPDQLYAYLNEGKALPSKPIMLTFDDTDMDQFTVAAPEMKKYGFKAVYFIMAVSIGRNGKERRDKGMVEYMGSDEIKKLSDAGNVIGSHTYDHMNFKKYTGDDWKIQIDKPTKRLEEITGKKIEYFAFPFGLWNSEGLPQLKKRGFKMAFALASKRDEKYPLLTVRRIIASGFWTPKTLSNSIKNSF